MVVMMMMGQGEQRTHQMQEGWVDERRRPATTAAAREEQKRRHLGMAKNVCVVCCWVLANVAVLFVCGGNASSAAAVFSAAGKMLSKRGVDVKQRRLRVCAWQTLTHTHNKNQQPLPPTCSAPPGAGGGPCRPPGWATCRPCRSRPRPSAAAAQSCGRRPTRSNVSRSQAAASAPPWSGR